MQTSKVTLVTFIEKPEEASLDYVSDTAVLVETTCSRFQTEVDLIELIVRLAATGREGTLGVYKMTRKVRE